MFRRGRGGWRMPTSAGMHVGVGDGSRGCEGPLTKDEGAPAVSPPAPGGPPPGNPVRPKPPSPHLEF